MLFGAEPRAAGHQYTAINASVKDFLLNVLELAVAVIWMLGVVYCKPNLNSASEPVYIRLSKIGKKKNLSFFLF